MMRSVEEWCFERGEERVAERVLCGEALGGVVGEQAVEQVAELVVGNQPRERRRLVDGFAALVTGGTLGPAELAGAKVKKLVGSNST